MRKSLRQHFHVWSIGCLIVVLLIESSCALVPSSPNSQGVSGNPFEEHRENAEERLRATHGFAAPDPEKGSFTYDGGAIEGTYFIHNEGTKTEWGLIVYVNGVLQPFAVDGKSNVASLHVFTIEKDTRQDIRLSFTPVVGKRGEELTVIVATVLRPSYRTDETNRAGYGYYHAFSMSLPMRLNMKQDAPGGTQVDCLPATKQKVGAIPAWGQDSGNTTAVIVDGGKEKVYLDKDTQPHVELSVIGRENQLYRVSFYIDHQLVSLFDGHMYLDLPVQKDKMTTYTLNVPYPEIANAAFVYMVAVPITDSFQIDSPPIQKSTSKAVTFSPPPTTSASAPPSQGHTTSAKSMEATAFTKVTSMLAAPAPHTPLSGFRLLRDHLALCSFATGETGKAWHGLFDLQTGRYTAYADNVGAAGDIQELDTGLALYEYSGRPPYASRIALYDWSMQPVASIDLTVLKNGPRIPPCHLSNDGKQLIYVTDEAQGSTVWLSDLTLKNPRKCFTYTDPKKTGSLSRINRVYHLFGDMLVFGGNVTSTETLIGLGAATTTGKVLQFKPYGYAALDGDSLKKTLIYGSLDMEDETFSGTAYTLDHRSGNIAELRFKSKEESRRVRLSADGRYAATFSNDPGWTVRLYQTDSSKLLKEWTLSSAPAQEGAVWPGGSRVAIHDGSRTIYLLLEDGLYAATF